MSQRVATIAIFGATASGKSGFAHRLADAIAARGTGCEIVACDAVMVYRGFDVGANKPTPAERARLPHHLLDVCGADDHFNAGAYARKAQAAISEITARGHVPIVVVGTYLYYRALVYGLGALPPSSPEVRRRLLEREAREPGFLARACERVDPASFVEAKGKNLPRLVRALEVFELTGRRASELRAAHGFREARFAVQRLGLRPAREILHARIAARVQNMLGAGLIEEVQRLRAQGISPVAKPMQALGYREVNAYLDGHAGFETLPALTAQIVQSTRQYARRQLKFFAKEPDVAWQEAVGEEAALEPQALERCLTVR